MEEIYYEAIRFLDETGKLLYTVKNARGALTRLRGRFLPTLEPDPGYTGEGKRPPKRILWEAFLMDRHLVIGGREFSCRLFVGTGKLPSAQIIPDIVQASKTQMITVALRRVNLSRPEEDILSFIPPEVVVLPNTSGARNAEEAVRIARLAREAGCGNFVKIEVIHEMDYLMPDNEETIKATAILAKEGFVVLPYVMPDLIVAQKLVDAGAAAVMPLGSPIGSHRGLRTRDLLSMLIEKIDLPIIVDAGIGKPSHAAEAMEMGADAVLVNTAIATSVDPVAAARAFSLAVEAGRISYLCQKQQETLYAQASSPLSGLLS